MLGGACIVAASILWGASVIGREIRCAGHLSSHGGINEVDVVAQRRAKGDPLRKQDEDMLLAGAVMAGCWFPKKRNP